MAQEMPFKTDFSKLSAITRLFVEHETDPELFPADRNGRVPALIQISDVGVLPNIPGSNQSQFGKIISGSWDKEEILQLTKDANIEWIEIYGRWNSSRLLNDTTRILSKVNEVQQGLSNGLPINYLGTGVVCGIVDIGFQTDNPTFTDMAGTNPRIKRFWHQNNNSGTAPSGFGYGTEFSAEADILSAKDDDGTHGTHVAGIMAGSGFTTPQLKLRGMSPDADLVFVTIKYSNDTLGGSAKGDYVVANPNILNGFQYVFDYAQSVGKPAVCNLSWGMHTGPHDGSSLFDKAVENLTGKGKIVVGAAGNEAGNQIHVTANLNSDTVYTFGIDRSRNDYSHENFYIDAWGESSSGFAANITLMDTFGNKLVETPFYTSNAASMYKKEFHSGTDTCWLTFSGNPYYVNNGKSEIILSVETNNARLQRVRIGFTGNGRFHAWNSGQTYRWTSGSFLDAVKGNNFAGKYLNGTQNYSVGENGGTGKSTITAGSYVARNNWIDYKGVYHAQNWLNPGEVSGFSSRGLTTDGRMKPDISAPGQLIASAVNYRTYAGWMDENTPIKSTYGGNDQYWTLFSGTSMASPHVAGIVGLMLQANPNLKPSEIREILKSTATHDTFTGKDSNIHYGYGKINAYQAVKRVVNLGIEQSDKKGSFSVYPNPATQSLNLILPQAANKIIKLRLTNAAGEEVYKKSLLCDEMGYSKWNLLELADGFYLCYVILENEIYQSKVLIRH